MTEIVVISAAERCISMTDTGLIIENLKNEIADELVKKISDSYSSEKYSSLIIKDAEAVAGAMIDELKEQNPLIKNQLITALDIWHNLLNKSLVELAVYETDCELNTLENNQDHFFVRESILSENPKYNEELHKKVLKAKLVSADYVPSSDNGIYIVNKDIEVLDLSTELGKCISVLDLRRLRRCNNIKKIIIPKGLKCVHLEEIKTRLRNVEIVR